MSKSILGEAECVFIDAIAVSSVWQNAFTRRRAESAEPTGDVSISGFVISVGSVEGEYKVNSELNNS